MIRNLKGDPLQTTIPKASEPGLSGSESSKKTLGLYSLYRYAIQSTVLLLVLLPYVLLTNFTATRQGILLHAVLLWLFLPLFLTWTAHLGQKYLASHLKSDLARNLLTDFVGISLASSLMVVVFHLISGEPYRILLSLYLWIALIPVYSGFLFFNLAIAYRAKANQALKLELASTKAAWQTLTAQIQPHFLFNSLNMIEHLVRADPEKAENCIRGLARLYQLTLEFSKSETVSLSQELEAVDHYLELQKERLGERLQIVRKVDSDLDCKRIQIPPHIILECIENAIKHGIEPYLKPGKLQPIVPADRRAQTRSLC